MTAIDLAPAAGRLADLVRRVPADALGAPTPCPAYTVGDLVDHIGGLAVAFAAAARKQPGGVAAPGDAARLGDDWRTRIPADLDALAAAWRDADAWSGMTSAGGVEMPGEVAGLVALDELVVHGWDLARATRRPYDGDVDAASLDAVHAMLLQFADAFAASAGEHDDPATRAFGPARPVAADAPLIDRVVALTGRDPAWRSVAGATD